jgi:hypothetical protein
LSDALKTILFFAALLAGLTLFFSSMLGPDVSGVKRFNNGVIQYFGPIDMQRVEKFKRLYQQGDKLLVNSNGGSLYAGIDMGNFIHQNRMTVEVANLCISSCANYIFLAAETKVLNKNSLVVFHGGPKQANFLSLMQQADASNAAPGTTFGQADYEGVVTIESASAQRQSRASNYGNQCEIGEIVNINGYCEAITAEQRLQYLIALEEQLYSDINANMDMNIPYRGQIDDFEKVYREYKYYGFFYSIESLRRLNVENVYTKDGEWSPQNNSLFNKVYEVVVSE